MKSAARIMKWIIWGGKEYMLGIDPAIEKEKEEEMERREDEAFKYGEPPEENERRENEARNVWGEPPEEE